MGGGEQIRELTEKFRALLVRAVEGQLEYDKRNNNEKCDNEYIAKELKTEKS